MAPPVRAEARALLAAAIPAGDRVLVIGATGWFGTTALALLVHHAPEHLHLVASRARQVDVDARHFAVHAWDEAQIAAFAPSVVLNFAFLTREKEAVLGVTDYRRANAELSRRFVAAASLPSVRAALTCSSGAALSTPEGHDLPIGAYGRLKLDEERQARHLATVARPVVVARAWSVSGSLVQRPRDYAFSDLVLQARSGRIGVTATSEVWRRYCGVDDYLAVCTWRAATGWSGTVDSGGPEVEMRALADLVADRYPGPRPQVDAVPAAGTALRYCSDGVSWDEACMAAAFRPATLAEQVDAVQAALP